MSKQTMRKQRRRLCSSEFVGMPGPSASTVRRHLRNLRKIVDESKDPCEMRIAYIMETAIRWARNNTVGWGDMGKEAVEEARILKTELQLS